MAGWEHISNSSFSEDYTTCVTSLTRKPQSCFRSSQSHDDNLRTGFQAMQEMSIRFSNTEYVTIIVVQFLTSIFCLSRVRDTQNTCSYTRCTLFCWWKISSTRPTFLGSFSLNSRRAFISVMSKDTCWILAPLIFGPSCCNDMMRGGRMVLGTQYDCRPPLIESIKSSNMTPFQNNPVGRWNSLYFIFSCFEKWNASNLNSFKALCNWMLA